MEERNLALQAKYEEIRNNEVRYETQQCEDADYVIVSFGSAARIGEKAMELAREEGLKVGLFRPITLWPFPTKQIEELAKNKKGERVQRRPDGRGCPLGSQWCHPRGALRPPGWYRSFTRGDC